MSALPFKDTAEVIHGGNTVIAALACSLWPLGSARETSSGESYDWMAEADLAARAELRKPNRVIKDSEGRRLKIVSATPHEFLPHIALRLSEMRSG